MLWDGVAQYYPWRHFASQTLRAGNLPLWNPYQFCGTPFLANGQSAVLYPPNILFWLLPTAQAFAWSAWLHLILTGCFAYLLLRLAGAGRFGALSGAVVWQANGFFLAWIHLPTVLCTATWLPLALVCIERALLSGRARYALAAGLALTLSYLGGHPHIFLLVSLLAAAYFVARGLSRATAATLLPRIGRLARAGLVAAAITLGLTAAQLLPTLGLLRIAHRTFVPGPETYAAFLKHAIPPVQLFGLVIPHAFGHPGLGTYVGQDNFAEYSVFVGSLALALALWGAIFSRGWHGRFFAGSLVLTILVALGTQANWPLYWWVPGMARAGGPARILLLTAFSLSVLAGLGADAAVRLIARGKQYALISLLSLLTVVAGVAWFWWTSGLPEVAEVQAATEPLARAEVLQAIALLALGAACLCALRRARFRQLAQVALFVILAADLLVAARHHLHITPADWAYAEHTLPAPAAGRVIGNATDWPIHRFPVSVLPPNAATVYHMRDVFGYDSLYLAHYRDFAAAIQHGDPSPPLNGNLLLARLSQTYGLDMMSLAGVNTVFSPVQLPWLAMERAGSFYTYRNPHAYPRAWLASSAVFRPTHTEAVAALVQLGPMPDCLIITGPDQQAAEFPPGPRPTPEVRDLSPNEVEVRLPDGGGGYLFLADSSAPGWRAYAGDTELPIRTAYVTFRAVAPPRDAGSVVFRYEPAGFRVGLFLALTTLACLCAAGGCAAARGRRS